MTVESRYKRETHEACTGVSRPVSFFCFVLWSHQRKFFLPKGVTCRECVVKKETNRRTNETHSLPPSLPLDPFPIAVSRHSPVYSIVLKALLYRREACVIGRPIFLPTSGPHVIAKCRIGTWESACPQHYPFPIYRSMLQIGTIPES